MPAPCLRLKSHKRANKSLADEKKKQKKRPRKIAKSDLGEDVAGNSQSLSMFDEDSVEEGNDNESDLQEHRTVGIVNGDGDSESEDIQEVFDTDQEQELDVKAQTVAKAPVSRSSFHSHLEYKLPETEVEDLLKKKWKYQWDVPAFGMPDCKWVGTGECFLEVANINSDCGLKQRLYKHWLDVCRASGSNDFHSSPQRFFFSLCNSYRDILHCNKKPFYCKGLKEDLAIMDAYIMHCLNHILRTRDLVTKNDSKLGKHWENAKDDLLSGDEFLDQGFTRPKVGLSGFH